MMMLATVVIDGAAQENDAVLEQAAKDVPGALAAVCRLDDVRVDYIVARGTS